ncbi:Uncharacterised protein [Serratia marcescens]|uniref:Uncharacterized protein n=1 Tax=Serratia marcescens TaxID=615 RepID=A0A379YJ32_SERMA|nr:Uncharacterised protein [Serratia marcescens]
MAFPKSHEILALTSQHESNNRVSANFLTREILNEALILVRSLSPEEVFRLTKTETGQIAFTLGELKDENNRRLTANNIESGQRPGGRINHLDNRINVSFPGTSWQMGARVQHFENIASSTVGGAGLVLIAGLWTGAGSGVGSILGRNAAQLAVVTGTYLGKRFVTNKTMVVNQMAAHIKNLADMFNSTHNAFNDFKFESAAKRAQYSPDPQAEHPITFEQKVTDNNAVPANHTAAIQAIVRRFVTGTYQRVDIVGQGDMFIKVFFSDGELDISQAQYDYLSNLKLPRLINLAGLHGFGATVVILSSAQKCPELTKRFLLSVRMVNDDDKADCRIGRDRCASVARFFHTRLEQASSPASLCPALIKRILTPGS